MEYELAARFWVECHLVKLPEGKVRFLIFMSWLDQREVPNYFRQGVLHVLGQTDTQHCLIITCLPLLLNFVLRIWRIYLILLSYWLMPGGIRLHFNTCILILFFKWRQIYNQRINYTKKLLKKVCTNMCTAKIYRE